jgi:hypothetical protein
MIWHPDLGADPSQRPAVLALSERDRSRAQCPTVPANSAHTGSMTEDKIPLCDRHHLTNVSGRLMDYEG